MNYKKFNLRDLSPLFKDSSATLEFYELQFPHESTFDPSFPRPALLICPGGAYVYCSDREGEPVALRFLTEGFNAFVLRYTCKQEYPVPQREVVFALNFIKEHQKEFHLTDDNPSIMGFSAGGHLVGSIALYYKEIAESLGISPKDVKPTAVIMGYPVVSTEKGVGEWTTVTTITGLKEDMIKKLSLENNVTPDCPPVYIFSTKTDTCVPPENAERFVRALKKNNVCYKYSLFEKGIHGGSLYSRGVYQKYEPIMEEAEASSIWVKEASKFIFDIVYK